MFKTGLIIQGFSVKRNIETGEVFLEKMNISEGTRTFVYHFSKSIHLNIRH